MNAQEILIEAGLGPVVCSAGWCPDVEEALKRLASIVARNGLDPLTRESIRTSAVEVLKSGKISGASRLVDAALGTGRREAEEEESSQGSVIILRDPEPWPEPVDGAELIQSLAAAFKRHLALPPGAACGMALWVLHCHALDASSISPRLALTSPERRCGKTSALAILMQLCPRPLPASNITAAALFRTTEQYQPTLLLDEADTYIVGKDADQALKGLINSGHRRATAAVPRCVDDTHEVRLFSTWAATGIALIGKLPDTLTDRSIVIPMRRRKPDEPVERLRDNDERLATLCRMAARWAADHMDQLRGADPELSGLNDRAMDNWRPLVAVADVAGENWPKLARRASVILSGEGADDDDSTRVQLLRDLHAIFTRLGPEQHSEEIISELGAMEERPWPEWKNGKPITAAQLARLLKDYRIKPKQVWRHGKNQRGYSLDQFKDAFERYTPPPDPLDPLKASSGAGFSPKNEPLEPDPSSGSKNAGNPHEQDGLSGLADQKGGSGEKETSEEWYRRKKAQPGWKGGSFSEVV